MPALADLAERLSREIPALMAEHRIPGVAVGICDSASILWTGTFGTTRLDSGHVVTNQTMFSVQSCSKMYAATTVMLAVQGGMLDLDGPIADYLPDFTVNSRFEEAPERIITLRHLLSHTAGFTHEAPVGNNFVVGRASFEQHCRSIASTWLRFPVGHHYEYSNLGIDLAAAAVTRASGVPFHEFAAREVLRPLGLTRTTFSQRKIGAERDRAIGHVAGGASLPVRIPMVAAGGLYTNVEDACRYLQFHLRRGEAVLGERQLRDMYAVPFGRAGLPFGYGLGVLTGDWPGVGTVRGHSGGGFGFSSAMYWAPAGGVGVAVLTNASDHPASQQLAEAVLRELAPGHAAVPGAARGVNQPSSRAELERFTGKWVGRSSVFRIVVEDDRLVMIEGAQREWMQLAAPREVVLAADNAQAWRLLSDDRVRSRYLESTRDGSVWYRNELARPSGPVPGEQPDATFHMRMMGGQRRLVAVTNDVEGLYLRIEGQARLRLEEHRPGLYFSTTGEALDLRGSTPTYANIILKPAGRVAASP